LKVNVCLIPPMKQGHSSDDTYNYTELCDFLKLLAMSECQCPYLCFI